MAAMRHSIMVSDQTWADYGGSPSAMREALVRYHAEQKGEERAQLAFEMATNAFVLRYDSWCVPEDHKLFAGDTARYVQLNGQKALVCEKHYSEHQA